MATLEYKRRVRLPEDFFLDQASMTRRPWPRWPLLALGWVAFTGLCFAITTDRVPLGQWLSGALEPAAEAAPKKRSVPTPTPAHAPLISDQSTRGETPTEGAAAEEPEGEERGDGSEVGSATQAPGVLFRAAQADDPAKLDIEAPEPPELASETAPDQDEDDAPRTEAALPSPPPEEEPKPVAASQSSVGASCEAAIANYQEEIRIGGASAPPDLSRAQFASVLENGGYFAHCGVPDSMSLEICAAVRNGRAVGISVRTAPGDRGVQSCVARAVRGLSFPAHPRMDVTRTRFAAQ